MGKHKSSKHNLGCARMACDRRPPRPDPPPPHKIRHDDSKPNAQLTKSDSPKPPIESVRNSGFYHGLLGYCKEVIEMDVETLKERSEEYLELFNDLKLRTGDERSAQVILQEVGKDIRRSLLS